MYSVVGWGARGDLMRGLFGLGAFWIEALLPNGFNVCVVASFSVRREDLRGPFSCGKDAGTGC